MSREHRTKPAKHNMTAERLTVRLEKARVTPGLSRIRSLLAEIGALLG
jgi:hypothetical protein